MNKTRTSFATLRTRTQINVAAQGVIPCPNHPGFNISHVCLNSQCQSNIQFCSECLFDSNQQQHLAKHKEQIIGWNDLMQLCRRQSVSGRLGDEPQRDLNQLVLQTSTHQQNFKQYMKQQEQQMTQDFDNLIQKFTEMTQKIKQEFMAPFKTYLQDITDIGGVLEKLVQEYYLEKNKDYNNDYDNFLAEISKLQEQFQKNQVQQFNLRKLMQNIIPLLLKANNQFQKQQQQQPFDENQSQASGLSLFSSFSVKQSDNIVLNDLVQEYKTLLSQRPVYKNQGLAQQVYNQILESFDKMYHTLESAEFLNPSYKSCINKGGNKENMNKASGRLNSPKSTKFIETIIKDTNAKQLTKLTKQLEVDEDEQKELALKQQLRFNSQIQIIDSIQNVSHLKTIKTTHKAGINCMIQVDEDFIATGSNDRTVKIYRYRVYELFKEINFKSDITSLSVLIRKDGSPFLIVGIFKEIVILNQGFEVFKVIEKAHAGQINATLSLNDSITIFSCGQNDNKLMQWNLNNDQSKKYFEHRDTITCLTLLNEQHVASGGKDRSIKVYKMLQNNNQFEKLQLALSLSDAHPTEITSLSYAGNNYLLSSSSSGELKVWDFVEGTQIKSIKNYAGWCFKIIYFYMEEQPVEQQPMKSYALGSPKKQKIPQPEGYVGTFSFDGTMKLFTMKQIFTDEKPLQQLQLKSLHDCHPFGGICAIRDAITDKLELLTSGNKNDPNIQVYGIK